MEEYFFNECEYNKKETAINDFSEKKKKMKENFINLMKRLDVNDLSTKMQFSEFASFDAKDMQQKRESKIERMGKPKTKTPNVKAGSADKFSKDKTKEKIHKKAGIKTETPKTLFKVGDVVMAGGKKGVITSTNKNTKDPNRIGKITVGSKHYSPGSISLVKSK